MFSFALVLLMPVALAIWPNCDESLSTCDSLPVCPDCRFVDCIPEITAQDCPEGTILEENLAGAGCCPACVKESIQFESLAFLKSGMMNFSITVKEWADAKHNSF